MMKLIKPSRVQWTDFAINLYRGCSHGCRYQPVGTQKGCYAFGMAYRFGRCPSYEEWLLPRPVCSSTEVQELLVAELPKIPAGKRIWLSSMSDPYQPLEASAQMTRAALEVLLPSDKHIIVLTKSDLVTRDIDLFKGRENVEVGVTLTFLETSQCGALEPYSATPLDRIEALQYLAMEGVPTFISIEPWLPLITRPVEIMKRVGWFIKRVILGKLNHVSMPSTFYAEELPAVVAWCQAEGIELLVKKELAEVIL